MAFKPTLGFGRRAKNATGFSLVEVVVAMGVVAFALIVLFALVPVGLKSNSDSLGESQAVNLLQALIADRRSTTYSQTSSVYALPALTAVKTQQSATFYVMEDGVTTSAQPAGARYRVNYTVYPANTIYPGATNYPAASVPMPVSINFKVSWPAVQATKPSTVETVATFMTP